MKITICGSMAFAKEIIDVKNKLEEMGHICYMPEGVNDYANGIIKEVGGSEGAERKIANNLIFKHYELINNSDAVLVANYDKKGIKNYIGGNSFLEIGFAFILKKPIYLINEIPEMGYKDEIEAMQPIILNGDFSKVK